MTNQVPVFVQFSNATKINKIVNDMQPYLTIDPINFFNDYFNLATCTSEGLDNWGRILDFSRSVPTPSAPYFGFDNGGPLFDNYPQAFEGPQGNPGGSFTTLQEIRNNNTGYDNLPDDEYRLVLQLVYSTLNCNMSLKAINKIMNVFAQSINPTYRVQVIPTPGVTMSLDYKFNYTIPGWIQRLLVFESIVPIPLGVTMRINP
jgi:hypothetical protein